MFSGENTGALLDVLREILKELKEIKKLLGGTDEPSGYDDSYDGIKRETSR